MKKQRGHSETMGTGNGTGLVGSRQSSAKELVMRREKETSASRGPPEGGVPYGSSQWPNKLIQKEHPLTGHPLG